jgi:hypothetical protein
VAENNGGGRDGVVAAGSPGVVMAVGYVRLAGRQGLAIGQVSFRSNGQHDGVSAGPYPLP